jgi:hypothetical protein
MCASLELRFVGRDGDALKVEMLDLSGARDWDSRQRL